MQLSTVSFMNFRSYRLLEYEFRSPVTVLVGRNGAGKTNFLEGLSFLGTTRSFRTRKHWDVVQWGEETCSLSCTFRFNPEEEGGTAGDRLGIVVDKKRKKRVFRYRKESVSILDFLGKFPVILFAPDDVLMVYGAPRLRRQFLDLTLSQISPDYFRALAEYQRVVRHRNTLLGHIRDQQSSVEELEFWDGQLAEHGALLMCERLELIRQLHTTLSEHYSELALKNTHCYINYIPASRGDVETLRSFSDCLGFLQSALVQQRDRELRYGRTLVGPHIDDFRLYMNDRVLAEFASRGEVRSFVLALKLAQRDLYRDRLRQLPLMLFDDVFSELDIERRSALLKLISPGQAVFTATDIHGFSEISAQADILTVKPGRLELYDS